MNVDEVVLSLSRDEALVLFEWLARLDSTNSFTCEDHAEEVVLWTLHGRLEKVLAEPFSPQYTEMLNAARQRVRESE
jgi:hypothetical protein